jgi:hypothetical protein
MFPNFVSSFQLTLFTLSIALLTYFLELFFFQFFGQCSKDRWPQRSRGAARTMTGLTIEPDRERLPEIRPIQQSLRSRDWSWRVDIIETRSQLETSTEERLTFF